MGVFVGGNAPSRVSGLRTSVRSAAGGAPAPLPLNLSAAGLGASQCEATLCG